MHPVDQLIQDLDHELPLIWERAKTDELTGGIVKARTLANKMSQGDSPDNTFRMGRRVVIEKKSFLKWLAKQLEPNRQSGHVYDLAKIRSRKKRS